LADKGIRLDVTQGLVERGGSSQVGEQEAEIPGPEGFALSKDFRAKGLAEGLVIEKFFRGKKKPVRAGMLGLAIGDAEHERRGAPGSRIDDFQPQRPGMDALGA